MRTSTRLLALLTAVTAAGPAFAQTVKTIVNQGPPAELYDIVILGDGYTAAQQAQFDADCLAVANYFKTEASLLPYPQYFHVYNVHTVFRASAQSGASKPPLNIFVNNAYGSSYWTGGTERCLYITNTSLASADAALAPDTDGRVMVLVNDSKYGGCASTFSVSYNGTDMRNVQAHEWGHSLGGVADEYDYGNTGTYTGPEPAQPNITKSSTGAGKWPLWLGFPGPNGTVGAYLGAGYWPAGLYRPEPDCEMRSLYRPFCTICREQFIKRWNQEVVMIGAPTPTSPTTAAQHSTKSFSFTDRLATRPHTIEWKVDAGSFVAGTKTFDWNVGAASVGPHTVTVRVRDTSSEVRNDPSALLTHSYTWTVNVTATYTSPAPLEAAEGNSNNTFPIGGSATHSYQQGHGDLKGKTLSINRLSLRRDGTVGAGTYPAKTLTGALWFGGGNVIGAKADYALNFTTAKTNVVTSKPISVPDWSATAGSPAPFNCNIPLDAPYAWNGLNDFIWEMRVSAASGTTASYADAASYPDSATANSASYGTACTAFGKAAPHTLTGAFTTALVGGGHTLSWKCVNGPNSAATALLIGVAATNIPLFGLCTNIYTSPVVNLAGGTDATGTWNVGPLPVAYNPGYIGAHLFAQMASFDPLRGDLLKLSVTNGADTMVPAIPGAYPIYRIFNTSSATATTGTLIPGYGLVIRLD